MEQEQRGADHAEYGKQVLKELAERLSAEFGSGFSRSNLEYMRRFYLAYPNQLEQISQTSSGVFSVPFSPFSISQTPSGELGGDWPGAPLHSQQGWTLRELKRQFNAGLYERLALSRDKQAIRDFARHGQHVSKPQDLLKEPL